MHSTPENYQIDERTLRHYLRQGRLERSIAIRDAFRGLSRRVRNSFVNHAEETRARGCDELAIG